MASIEIAYVEEAEVDPSLLRRFERMITVEERRQLCRLRFEADRRRFLIARALARTELSLHAPVAPADWRFEKRHHGRPEIAASTAARRLRFNLSHTEGLVACAVAFELDVGIDVERLDGRLPTSVARERCLSRRENADLEGLPARVRDLRFLEYWTLKESYLKARGTGLWSAPHELCFEIDATSAWARLDPARHDDAREWQFRLLRPTHLHVLALAARAGAADIGVSLWRSVPTLERMPIPDGGRLTA